MARSLSYLLKTSRKNRHTGIRPARRSLRVEGLEDRLAPAVLYVWSNADVTGPVTPIGNGVYDARTLRAAIDAANNETAFPGADVIQFAMLPGQNTIGAASNDTNKPFAFGPTAFVVNSDITIQGATSSSPITIDGLGQRRLFGVMAGAKLTLQAVTLTGGNAQGGNGGNVPNGIGWGGGGGGAAGLGGAIFNNGALNLLQSTLSGNTAQGGNGGSGGDGGVAMGAGGGGPGGNGGDVNNIGSGGGGGVGGAGTGGYLDYGYAFGPYSAGGLGGANEFGVPAVGGLWIPGGSTLHRLPGNGAAGGGGGGGHQGMYDGGHGGSGVSLGSGGFGGGGGGGQGNGAWGGAAGFGGGGGGGSFNGSGGSGGFGGGGGGSGGYLT